jgi:hypothetical protein
MGNTAHPAVKLGAQGNRRAVFLSEDRTLPGHRVCRNVPRTDEGTRMLFRALALLAALFLLPGCEAIEGLHALRALPPAVEAVAVEFSRNESYGIGPGGNETGFNVIRLADDGAARVAEGGVAWLNAQPGGRVRPDWKQTPVPRDHDWMGRPDSAAGAWPDPTVRAVLDRYGFGFDPPTDHQTALDAAMNAPGSYYAFGPGGLVVVIVPATRRAYVFYAG